MGRDKPSSEVPVNRVIAAVAMTVGLGAGCSQPSGAPLPEPWVAADEERLGVMERFGFSIPDDPSLAGDDALDANDVWLTIRSFEPSVCSMLDASDLFSDAREFSWAINLLLPAEKLAVGQTFQFGGNECAAECVVGSAETWGGQDGPLGPWSGTGYRCGDDSYDLPIAAEVVAVDDDAITIEIYDLCLLDSGPSQDGPDDPSDDVLYDASGRYRIEWCETTDPGIE